MVRLIIAMIMLVSSPGLTRGADARERWSVAQANAWYVGQRWLVGSNYIPATAINSLEMWQAETFDPKTIDTELGWAQSIGMNAMRVFLHHLLWEQDPRGFKDRINQFLDIADRHGIKVMFVLFDSCGDANPHLGPQHPPIPGVHNSGWVQGPGRDRLEDKLQYPKLSAYVRGIVGAFASDQRIIAWDLWNEPTYADPPALSEFRLPWKESEHKAELVQSLLAHVFDWARVQDPVQPLTSGLFSEHDWEPEKSSLSSVDRIQLEQADIISFHDYSWPEVFEERVRQLSGYGRPILCTEFMARNFGSTFDGSLPIGKRLDVGMFNWGLVDGRTQTRIPWDSWVRPYTNYEPPVWQHDVFRADGTPYRSRETRLIKALSMAPRQVVPAEGDRPGAP